MNQEIRIILGLLVFYLFYTMLVDFTALSNIPLVILIFIFISFLFLPDVSTENNFINKNQKMFALLLFLTAIGVYIYTNLLLIPLTIIGFILILIFLTTNPTSFKSITTGIYLSAPLFFINPFYFLFAFLGYLTYFISSKI